MSEKIVRNVISINAPADKVWDILTNPEQTKKYMYGCGAISDWQPGSRLDWKGVWEGKEMVAVTGKIVEIDPDRYLAYTTFDPNNAAIPDVEENYLTVTCTLVPDGNTTELTVTQGDFAVVADGEKRYIDAINAGGWDSILSEIKKIAEE